MSLVDILRWVAIIAPWLIWGMVKFVSCGQTPREIADEAMERTKGCESQLRQLAVACGFTWVYDEVVHSLWGFQWGKGGRWIKASDVPKQKRNKA